MSQVLTTLGWMVTPILVDIDKKINVENTLTIFSTPHRKSHGLNATLQRKELEAHKDGDIKEEKTGIIRHLLGGAVIFISFQNLIAPALKYSCPACPPNKGGRQ